jgi:hypothetical protein
VRKGHRGLPLNLLDRKSLRYRLQQRLVRCRRSQDVDGSPVQKPAAMFGAFASNVRERGTGEPVKNKRASDRYFSLQLIPHFRLMGPRSNLMSLVLTPSKRHLQSGSTPAHVLRPPPNLSTASKWQIGRWPSVSGMCCVAWQQLRGLCQAHVNVIDVGQLPGPFLFNTLSS